VVPEQSPSVWQNVVHTQASTRTVGQQWHFVPVAQVGVDMLHAPATPYCPDPPAVPPVDVEPPTCVAPAAPPSELEPAAVESLPAKLEPAAPESLPPKLEPAAPESLPPKLEPAAPETLLPPEPGAPPLELPQAQMTNTAAQANKGNLQNIKVNSLTQGTPRHQACRSVAFRHQFSPVIA